MNIRAAGSKYISMVKRIFEWVDVKKVITALIFAIAGYAFMVLNNAAEAHEAGMAAHKMLVGNGGPGVVQILQEIQKDIKEIKDTQKAYELKEFYIYNAIANIGNFGPNTPFIMVNELGMANVYRDEVHMKVTNVSSSSRESLIFKVQGTFRDENPMNAIKISQRAAHMLGVDTASASIHVEIRPVSEGYK